MNKLLLAALALPFLVGCGLRSSRYSQPRGYTGTIPPANPTFPASTPDYLIDAGADVDSPLGTYAITTNGQDWILGWQGDGLAHRFTGDVYCPAGCTFEYAVFDNLTLGDTISNLANNHLGFDAVTDHSLRQQLTFGSPLQPITFNLFIDGRPAVQQEVFFPSGGYAAYADVMPFNLVSSNATFAAAADLAPEATLKPGTTTVKFSAPTPRKSGEVVTASTTQQAGQ